MILHWRVIFDYLVKPVRFDRFLKSTTKLKDYLDLKSKAIIQQVNNDRIFIRSGGKSFLELMQLEVSLEIL